MFTKVDVGNRNREIVFDGSNEDDEDEDDNDDVLPRAWENLMPKKRILIYCLP
ncbi:hypothetical protein OROMI_004012 [Orobanche minor]